MGKRIEWIDAAKGFAICGTVVSHTVPFGSFIRNFLFSFHMPLFFLLSGFTTNPPSDRKTFYKKIKKDAKSLLIPVIVFSLINFIYYFIVSNDFSVSSFFKQFGDYLLSLFWSSGVPVHGAPHLGMLWFLVSIFTARTIFNISSIVFKSDKYKIVPLSLGMIGVLLGSKQYYLPFNFDVSLVALLFISLGYLAKEYFMIIQKWFILIFIPSLFLWVQTLIDGKYIELATRNYGNSMIVFIEAICGTIVICSFIKVLCELKPFRKILTFFGLYSLVVLCAHSLDGMTYKIWNQDSIILSCAIRLSIVLAASSIYIFIKSNCKKEKINNDLIRLLAIVKLSNL